MSVCTRITNKVNDFGRVHTFGCEISLRFPGFVVRQKRICIFSSLIYTVSCLTFLFARSIQNTLRSQFQVQTVEKTKSFLRRFRRQQSSIFLLTELCIFIFIIPDCYCWSLSEWRVLISRALMSSTAYICLWVIWKKSCFFPTRKYVSTSSTRGLYSDPFHHLPSNNLPLPASQIWPDLSRPYALLHTFSSYRWLTGWIRPAEYTCLWQELT